MLNLSGVDEGLLGALLEDASSCAQLQELQLRVAGEVAGAAAGSSWAQGLAALAGGPCRHSLRSIKIEGDPFVPCSPTQAAPLLLPGALPQLRELQLDVRVHAARSARLQQAGGTAAAGEVPGSPEQLLQLLAGELEQAGVQGLGALRLEGAAYLHRTGVMYWHFAGVVGRCELSGTMWVALEPGETAAAEVKGGGSLGKQHTVAAPSGL